MSAVVPDKFGVWKIALDEEHNTPGSLEVDGDEFACGPVAFLRFALTSDYPGREPDGELEFGTFRIQCKQAGTMTGGVLLNQQNIRDLIAALQAQVD